MTLAEYVRGHSERNACRCGHCFISGEDKPLGNHTVEVAFFDVSVRGPATKEALKRLVETHKGEFVTCDLLDGQEHNYLEIGAWIGDQGLALQLMGLGKLLGLWKLMTPKSLLRDAISDELAMQMAGAGMVTIQCELAEKAG